LFEVFTGRLPFSGDSPISVGFQQIKDDPPLPSSINPQISEEVEEVILKALRKDPFERYRTVTDLKRALEAAIQIPSTIPVSSSTKEKATLETSRE
jgi:serine/threonine-protein kinase